MQRQLGLMPMAEISKGFNSLIIQTLIQQLFVPQELQQHLLFMTFLLPMGHQELF